MKRIISALLAISFVLCILLLASCGKENPDTTSGNKATEETTTSGETSATTKSSAATSDTSQTSGTTAASGETTVTDGGTTALTGKEKHPDFMDVNFGGKTFNFAVQQGWSGGWDCYEICAEATGSDNLITEAIINRNSVIENLYNCKITQTQSDDTRVLISTDRATGQHNYDFSMRLWYEYGMPCYNIAALDIDLTHSWWNQDYIDTLSFTYEGAKVVHSLSGKFNLNMYDSVVTMFADMDIYDRAKAAGKTDIDLYQTVRNGKWTVDKMLTLMEAVRTDVDGNSQMKYEDGDIFGLLINPNVKCQYGLFYGFGLKSVVKNENDKYACMDSSNTDLSFVSSLIDLAGSVYKNPAFGSTGELNSVNALANGQALFNVQWLYRLHSDNEMINYGIKFDEKRLAVVPFPKYDETQENYGTYVSNRGYGIRVPDTILNPNEAAQFLEVFGYHSEMLLYPEYIKCIKTQCLCDEGAGEMLDIVLRTRVWEYDNFRNGGMMSRLTSFITSGKNQFTKALASMGNSANSVYDSHMATLKKLK